MQLNHVTVNGISSLLSFRNDQAFQKTNLIFGTNGSGKSSLVGALRVLNDYMTGRYPEAKDNLQRFLRERASKENAEHSIEVLCDFGSSNCQLTYDFEHDDISVSSADWATIRVFDDDYVDRTVGPSINVDLAESGIVVGEANRELSSARQKLENLESQLQQHQCNVDDLVERLIADFKNRTQSTMNLQGFVDREVALADTCDYQADNAALEERAKLGFGGDRQELPSLDISATDLPFDKEQVDQLSQERVLSPSIRPEIEEYLKSFDQFYRAGIEISRKMELSNVCPFCQQSWPQAESRINEYKEFLESHYTEKKDGIRGVITQLKQYKNRIERLVETVQERGVHVAQEAERLGVSSKTWIDLQYDQDAHDRAVSLLNQKIEQMEEPVSVAQSLQQLASAHSEAIEANNRMIEAVNSEIRNISTNRQRLNKRIAKHFGYMLWSRSAKLREKIKKTEDLITETKTRIEQLEADSPDEDTVRKVFNGFLEQLGLGEYHLDHQKRLQLVIEQEHDITEEGNRVSSAQRKLIALAYFFAEMVSEASNRSDLKDCIVVFDDPVDSADYVYFYSIASIIENAESLLSSILQQEVKLGQFFVFTHNSLLFERLGARWSNFRKAVRKVGSTSVWEDADKSINNYTEYIDIICRYYTNPRAVKAHRIFVGNVIRRVLEILASFETLGSNDVHVLLDGADKKQLAMVANHMSHESFTRFTDPLSTEDALRDACGEVLKLIKDRHRPQYDTIVRRNGVSV